MVENKLICILLGLVLVFATLPSEAKVYWFNYPTDSLSPEDGAITFPRHVDREQMKRGPIDLIYDVIKHMVTSRQKRPNRLQNVESVENKCARLFGSIYGTKQQRILCLDKLKKKRQKSNYKATSSNENNDKHTFTDLTRQTDSSESNIRTDVMYSPEFSSDYIDFRDLRSNVDTVKHFQNWRKSIMNNKMDSIQHQRTLYTSDSDSDESVEVKKKNKRYSKKPKRFEVIDNDKSKKKTNENTDDTDDDSSSDNYLLAKPNKKDINLNNEHYLQGNYDSSDLESIMKKGKEHYLQGNDDISEDEFEEPVKKKKKKSIKKKTYKTKGNHKKEYYLQGGRLLSLSSVEDGRRRLPHFLPKRFHWSEEEMQNLGYFWFNGPQGRYSKFRIRE